MTYSARGKFSREDLVDQYAPLVKRIAYHLIARLPPSVLVDDLIQAGMLGLLDAAALYDPGQGASFETYATIRVRGAMLDELRRSDWAPKSVHRRGRELADAIHRVEVATGRDASDLEIAEEMGIDLAEYYRIVQECSSSRFISFDELDLDEHGVGIAAGQSIPVPHETVQREQFKHGLANAIAGLPERERLVLTLYYDNELNLREIGVVLGVSESRVSQILSQTHLRLRSRLSDWIAH